MSVEKRLPERRCVGCGDHYPKSELIRVVRTPEGEIALDMTGKKNGRGAYLCPRVSCLSKARKSARLSKNLDCPIPDELYTKLEMELEAHGSNR